ncbi:barstar family protein [Streptomyces exfoliatus]|uniref:Barstar family protein n=1 Tax=Streptomyces exfoliatus TaxID=1905 RepID=A0ABV3CQ78_STREX
MHALIRTEDDHVWGVCPTMEGLYGDPERGTYELRGWVPEGAGVREGWLGESVWLVPADDEPGSEHAEYREHDAWLLADAEAVRVTGELVLAGEDDHMGPPESHRGPVRLHDGRRWLGSCEEFTRVQPAPRPRPPFVLRGLVPGGQLRAALEKGTRRALELEQVELELRDRRGEPLTSLLMWGRVARWRPSALGSEPTDQTHQPDQLDLISVVDLELDSTFHHPVPAWARPVWERWLTGPPEEPAAWAGLDTRLRGAWHDLVRERACRRTFRDRPAGATYELDGRHVTDEPGLWLALGEAVNGPGGYFGGNFGALHDCLGGFFGFTAPGTLVWRDSAVARTHLSRLLSPEGEPYDLFASMLSALAEDGMRVVEA